MPHEADRGVAIEMFCRHPVAANVILSFSDSYA